MTNAFKTGDVVQLKSGGPAMTIQNVDDYSYSGAKMDAKCVWFDGPKLQEGIFKLDALEPYTRPEPIFG